MQPRAAAPFQQVVASIASVPARHAGGVGANPADLTNSSRAQTAYSVEGLRACLKSRRFRIVT